MIPHLMIALHSARGARERHQEAAAVIPLGGATARVVDGGPVELAAACPRNPGAVLVAIDGLGGGGTGDLACAEVLGVLADELGAQPPGERSARREWLVQRLEQVSARLQAAPPTRGGPWGAAMALAMIVGDELDVLNLGDVRAYLRRDGSLCCLTTDHSLRADALAAGVAPDEVAKLPDNVLVRMLGLGPVSPSVTSLELAPGDELLLVTRGVWRALGNEGLRARLEQRSTLTLLAEDAMQAGADDNLTLVLARPVAGAPDDPQLVLGRFPELILANVAWELGGPPFSTREELVAAVRQYHQALKAQERWVDKWRTEAAACRVIAPGSPASRVCSWLPDALYARWPPERIALWAARAQIGFDEGGRESMVTLAAPDGERFSAAELLFQLHNSVAGRLAAGAPRFFEGLSLAAVPGWATGAVPFYRLQVGRDVARVPFAPLEAIP